MKKILLLLLITFFSGHISNVFGQGSSEISHYVTIGVFAKLDNAIRWTDKANKADFSAQYAMNPARQLYYVYILDTPDKRKAFSMMLKIRVETEYNDAWVFSGKLGEEVEEEPIVQQDPEPEPEPEPEPVVIEPVEDPVVEPVVEVPVEDPVPEGKPFYFKLVSKGEDVLGEIHVLETARASQYQAFKGNEVVYLKTPRNTAKAFIAAVQAPGYRPVEITVDYEDPSALSSGIGSSSEIIIPIELVRSKRGDYIEFNNVRFFGNSAIFQPEAKLELDGLLDLMKEQTKYKITVHGHCNGTQSRNVVVKGSSNEFFETNTLNTRETLSAKALTEARANLVKEYLVSEGISAKRIKTKAEGGKAMIYPQSGTLSGYNDRIEVEIKKGK